MNDSTQALERKAVRSRSRLAGLMEDLQRQISPGQMLDQVIGFSKGDGSALSQSIIQQISKNPLPFLLIAGGIGWLIVSDMAAKTPAPRKRASRRRKSSKRKAAA